MYTFSEGSNGYTPLNTLHAANIYLHLDNIVTRSILCYFSDAYLVPKQKTSPFSRMKSELFTRIGETKGLRIGWELSSRRDATRHMGPISRKDHLLHQERWGWGPRGLRFEGYSGVQGVETTLDRSCSGQRVAISPRTSRNRATFAFVPSVKTPQSF